ncbi:MAG: transcription termination factor NusA [Planctomycetes bacterium]|nr:transcription termination factor NusA [Planctomycetota bacterium]
MASSDILRYVESIAKDKEIDAEQLIAAIEQSVAQAVARKYGIDDLGMRLDRQSGAWVTNYEIDLEREGRILAQAVKQAIIGRVREAERDVLFAEFESKIGEIVSGTIQRFEGDTTIVNLGRNMEGILPRAEKVRGETYNVGDRIRALVLEVKKAGSRVKVILSRGHRDLVRALFELEVPEIAEGVIAIRRIEREPGYRTKLAVDSGDERVDCVGACVGVRGTRIKSIIDELNGERIDIIRWTESAEQLIRNALKPAEISHIELDDERKKALVLVDEDQLSLAIGRRGQNVRLASRMTHWEIDIMTRAELEKSFADEDGASKAAALAAARAAGETTEGDAVDGDAVDGEPAVSRDVTAETAAGETATGETAHAGPTADDGNPAGAATGDASGDGDDTASANTGTSTSSADTKPESSNQEQA